MIPYRRERGPTTQCPPTPQFWLNFLLRSKVYSKERPPWTACVTQTDFRERRQVSQTSKTLPLYKIVLKHDTGLKDGSYQLLSDDPVYLEGSPIIIWSGTSVAITCNAKTNDTSSRFPGTIVERNHSSIILACDSVLLPGRSFAVNYDGDITNVRPPPSLSLT